MKHISEVEDKQAGNLARNGVLQRDPYHDRIFEDAQKLYFYKSDLVNFLAVCVYCSQFLSGATLWKDPESGGTVIVDTEGQIKIQGIPEPMYGGGFKAN